MWHENEANAPCHLESLTPQIHQGCHWACLYYINVPVQHPWLYRDTQKPGNRTQARDLFQASSHRHDSTWHMEQVSDTQLASKLSPWIKGKGIELVRTNNLPITDHAYMGSNKIHKKTTTLNGLSYG